MNKQGKLALVVGGQLGSEGKGVIVNHIANEYDFHVRVGGPNAGHSFKYHSSDGRTVLFKAQGVPCGWTNPTATLVIGAGGLVDPELFLREIRDIEVFDPDIRNRVLIDPQATILDERHHQAEGGVDGEIHSRIGSTGEGVGAARHARMSRDPSRCSLARDVPELKEFISERPVADILYEALLEGSSVLIEGTQGSGLSLVHGPWPYTTSNDTNAAQMLADVGLPPSWVDDVILVVRTFPIRVAGNSGPLKEEVDWNYISERVGKPTEEKTTVTLKTRRVGLWDDDLFVKAVRLNNPTQIALTFADYLNPEDEEVTEYSDLSEGTKLFVDYLEELSGAPVTFIGTGGADWELVDRR